MPKDDSTGERPYVCVACQRGFSDPSSLVRHDSVHSGECYSLSLKQDMHLYRFQRMQAFVDTYAQSKPVKSPFVARPA